MDLHTSSVAYQLSTARTRDLERQHAILRSHADRGAALEPLPPTGSVAHRIGVWLHRRLTPARPHPRTNAHLAAGH